MEKRGQSLMNIRRIISMLMALFVLYYFGGLLLQYGDDKKPNNVEYDGVVWSMKDERFEYRFTALTYLGFIVVRKVPPSYQTEKVDLGSEPFLGYSLKTTYRPIRISPLPKRGCFLPKV